jgi:hypothetical protein
MLSRYEMIEEKYTISKSTNNMEQKNKNRSIVIYIFVFGIFTFFGVIIMFLVGQMVCDRDSLHLAGL